jgi:hypothetical protein
MNVTVYRPHGPSAGDDRPVYLMVQMTHAELDALCHLRRNLTDIARYALDEAIREGEAEESGAF